LETVAGVDVSFFIELRTTNKNLRVNYWYENPNDKIKLIFSKDDGASHLKYSVEKGDKKGKYTVTISSTKTYSKTDPNEMTLVIENVKVEGKDTYKPKVAVTPDEIDKVLITNKDGSQDSEKFADITVDDAFTGYFKA